SRFTTTMSRAQARETSAVTHADPTAPAPIIPTFICRSLSARAETRVSAGFRSERTPGACRSSELSGGRVQSPLGITGAISHIPLDDLDRHSPRAARRGSRPLHGQVGRPAIARGVSTDSRDLGGSRCRGGGRAASGRSIFAKRGAWGGGPQLWGRVGA